MSDNQSKRGRPSKYSQELADFICEQIAHGKALHRICESPDLPDDSTVFRWLEASEEFRDKYARAREKQAEFMAAEIVEIADEVPICTITDPNGNVRESLDSAGVNRNRLRVDARKWVASKLLPKKYGEFKSVEHSGPEGGAIQTEVTVKFTT